MPRPRNCAIATGKESSDAGLGTGLSRRATVTKPGVGAIRLIRHARRRSSRSCAAARWRSRRPRARVDRGAVACRIANPGGARSQRARSRPSPRVGAGPPRQGRTSPRGRHGRLGIRGTRAVAQGARADAGRALVLRHRRAHTRASLVRIGRAGRCRCAATLCPHQLRHAHAMEFAREGVPLNVLQRQLGTETPASSLPNEPLTLIHN